MTTITVHDTNGRAVQVSKQDLIEAEGWIADCSWAGDVDVTSLTDQQVFADINRHYSGGWRQFEADSRPFVSDL